MSGTEWPDLERAAEARQILRGLAADRAEVKRLRAEIERLQEYKRKQADDIITLGQMVGRLEAEIERLRAENADLHKLNEQTIAAIDEAERLRTALLEIASPTKWSAITPDSDGAITGMLIVSEMQRVARAALTGGKE